MSVSIGARPARAKAMVVSSEARPARAKAMSVSSEARPARAKAMSVSRERFVMPAGYGGAWPGFETTHRATHQRPRPTGVEGAGGSGGPGCDTRGRWRGLAAVPVGGGRARAGLEIDHSEPSGSRVAISRAGRRPRAHKAARPDESGPTAPGTPAGPQATQEPLNGIAKRGRHQPTPCASALTHP